MSKRQKRFKRRVAVKHYTVQTGGKPTLGLPFQGEWMRCVICDREEKSDPAVQSGWRAIELNGVLYYGCRDHFPGDDASTDEFSTAYRNLILRALRKRSDTKTAGDDES
jgi:hypothetical protein